MANKVLPAISQPKTGSVQFYGEGDDFFDAALADIKRAKESVTMDTYIWRDGDVTRRFVQALTKKAEAGVNVTVIYDRVGSRGLPTDFFHSIERAGGSVHGYRRLGPGLKTNIWMRFWRALLWTFLRRDHRKIIVIDRSIGYMGGINMIPECSRREWGDVRWLDSMVRLTEPQAVGHLCNLVADSLRRVRNPWYDLHNIRRKLPEARRIDFSGPQHTEQPPLFASGRKERPVQSIGAAFKTTIAESCERLYIASPYFLPYGGYKRALKKALKAGVDVRIYLTDETDHHLINRLGWGAARKMHRLGAKIFIYRAEPGVHGKRFLHAKILLGDDVVLFGSPNFDRRSFVLNLEALLVFQSPVMTAATEKLLDDIHAGSRPAKKSELRTPWPGLLLRPFIRFF